MMSTRIVAPLILLFLGFSAPAYSQLPHIFPQIAIGDGWSTRISLYNSMRSRRDCEVEFFDENGLPKAFSTDIGFGATLELRIPFKGSTVITIHSGDSLETGWAKVGCGDASNPVKGSAEFTFTDSAGNLLSFSSNFSQQPFGNLSIPIRQERSLAAPSTFPVRAAISVVNPYEFLQSVDILLFSQNGVAIGFRTILLNGRQKLSVFADELFEFEAGTTFDGMLIIRSANAIAVTSLSFRGTQFTSVEPRVADFLGPFELGCYQFDQTIAPDGGPVLRIERSMLGLNTSGGILPFHAGGSVVGSFAPGFPRTGYFDKAWFDGTVLTASVRNRVFSSLVDSLRLIYHPDTRTFTGVIYQSNTAGGARFADRDDVLLTYTDPWRCE